MRQSRGLSRFSLPIILLVAAIVFSTYLAISALSVRALKEQEMRSIVTYHERLSKYINEQINNIGTATLLYVSRNISAGELGLIEDDIDRKAALMRDIQVLTEATKGINSIYFYSGIEQLVMYYSESSITILPFDAFFDIGFYYEFLSWNRFTHLSGSRTVPINYRAVKRTDSIAKTTVISEVKRLPLRGFTRDVIVVNIEESFFQNMMASSNLPASSMMLMTDASGGSAILHATDGNAVPLSSKDVDAIYQKAYGEGRLTRAFSHVIDGRRFFVSAALHSRERLYYTIVPESSLSPGYSRVNMAMIIIELIILGVGICLAIFLSSTITRPLGTMMGRLTGNPPATKHRPLITYPLIKEMDRQIETIVRAHREQEARMESYFHSYKEGILLSILLGSLKPQRLPKGIFSFGQPDMSFLLVLCRFEARASAPGQAEEYDAYIGEVAECLSKLGHVDTLRRAAAEIIFILSVKKDAPDVLDGLQSALRDAAARNPHQVPVSFLVSGYCESMDELSQAYRNAEMRFGTLAGEERVVLVNAHGEGMQPSLHASILRQQDAVIAAVHGGERSRASAELDHLFVLMQSAGFPLEQMGEHCARLADYLEAGMAHEGSMPAREDVQASWESAADADQLREWMKQRLRRYFASGTEPANADTKNRLLIERVQSYIADHFHEDISLTTIAEYVFYTPQYLGKLFREETGMTFTNYLIKVRMEAAAALLVSTKHPVALIAELVGYTNVQSFCRMFKSNFACTPGEHRRYNSLDEA